MCGVLVLIQRRILNNRGVERKGCNFCFVNSTIGTILMMIMIILMMMMMIIIKIITITIIIIINNVND